MILGVLFLREREKKKKEVFHFILHARSPRIRRAN